MTSHRITARTRARKRAIDTIFEADQRDQMSPGGVRDLLDERRLITAAQTPLPDYAITIVEGVAERLYQIEDLLKVHTTTRAFDRLPSTDRAILRVATWEILWNDDVPPITAVDEAVTLAKEISTDQSPGVVNGILDAIRKEAGDVQAIDDAFAAAMAPLDEADSAPLDHVDMASSADDSADDPRLDDFDSASLDSADSAPLDDAPDCIEPGVEPGDEAEDEAPGDGAGDEFVRTDDSTPGGVEDLENEQLNNP